MSNYVTMQTRIANEIVRTGLTATIKEFIQDAIKHYERKHFWFNEQRANSVIADGDEFVALPTDFLEALSLTFEQGTRKYPMTERSHAYIEARQYGNFKNLPEDYAIIADQFRLYPISNGAYTLRLTYVKKLPALVQDTDTNAWMVEGEALIRHRAKRMLYADFLKKPQEAMVMQALEQDDLTGLEEETSRRVATGRLTPTTF